VWIPRRGEVAPQGVAGVVDPASAPAAPGPIDLNSATADQLDTLAGIGPSTAKAIIERRTQLGRFRSVDDLLSVKGIGESKVGQYSQQCRCALTVGRVAIATSEFGCRSDSERYGREILVHCSQ